MENLIPIAAFTILGYLCLSIVCKVVIKHKVRKIKKLNWIKFYLMRSF